MIHFHACAAALVLLVTLSACTTMHAGSAHGGGLSDPEVRLLIGRSVAELRQLGADLATPVSTGATAVDTSDQLALIDAARVAVIAAGAVELDRPGLAAKAQMATLTLLLTYCRDRVRAADGLESGSPAAHHIGRLLGQRCTAPLALMLG